MPSTDPRKIARAQRKLDEITARRRAAQEQKKDATTAITQATEEATPLVVELLESGVPRSALVGRPFSGAYLSMIQKDYGLRREDKKKEHTP